MSVDGLFKDLVYPPTKLCHFGSLPEINDDAESIASLGSCCSSPTRSSDDSSSSTSAQSPVEDTGSGYFLFPTEYVDLPARVTTSLTGRKKATGGEKPKRKTAECKVKRNERERRRVRRLADGFKKLRTVVPADSKKLSKLNTLKCAMSYIQGLSTLLEFHDVQVMQDFTVDRSPKFAERQVTFFLFLSSRLALEFRFTLHANKVFL